jgi:8-oxo-dGTP diphosphatase
VYKLGKLKNYKYTVVFARYQEKWVLCKHKNRDTWENSGGHIENNETPIKAARRELFEETGAIDFEIVPICDYWACDEPHETENITWSNGQVFLANISKIGKLPENEMECIEYFENFPGKLTYPDITKELLPYVMEKIKIQRLKIILLQRE